MKKIFALIKTNKIISAIIIALVIFGVYKIYQGIVSSNKQTSYGLAAVERGILVSSVSGTGQVAATSQIDVQAQVSANVVGVYANEGQKVKAGDLLVKLDDTNAQKALRDAQTSLNSAKISLAKLLEPADTSTIAQANYSLLQAQQSAQNLNNSLSNDFNTAYNTISSAYIDLSNVMSNVTNILYGTKQLNNLSTTNINFTVIYYGLAEAYSSSTALADQYIGNAASNYTKALADYNQNQADYENSSRYSPTSTIASLLTETIQTTKQVSEVLKNAKTYFDFINNIVPATQVPTNLASQETQLESYASTINTDFSNLSSAASSITNDENSLITTQQNIISQQATLTKLQNGPDPLDIQLQQLAVQQAQNNLTDAQNNLADYYIRSPIDGVVAKLNFQVGDLASGAIATIVSPQQYANIPLNEVDAAKVALNQKATLTFDAIDGLNLTGHVGQIDTLGTVSQGVVTYNVEIFLGSQDGRIKPGMSVSADIITSVLPDVLLVPNAAIKSQGQLKSVQLVSSSTIAGTLADGSTLLKSPPKSQTVIVGASNDTYTQIISGLNENDLVVIKTVNSSQSTSQTTQTNSANSLRLPGLGGLRR